MPWQLAALLAGGVHVAGRAHRQQYGATARLLLVTRICVRCLCLACRRWRCAYRWRRSVRARRQPPWLPSRRAARAARRPRARLGRPLRVSEGEGAASGCRIVHFSGMHACRPQICRSICPSLLPELLALVTLMPPLRICPACHSLQAPLRAARRRAWPSMPWMRMRCCSRRWRCRCRWTRRSRPRPRPPQVRPPCRRGVQHQCACQLASVALPACPQFSALAALRTPSPFDSHLLMHACHLLCTSCSPGAHPRGAQQGRRRGQRCRCRCHACCHACCCCGWRGPGHG